MDERSERRRAGSEARGPRGLRSEARPGSADGGRPTQPTASDSEASRDASARTRTRGGGCPPCAARLTPPPPLPAPARPPAPPPPPITRLGVSAAPPITRLQRPRSLGWARSRVCSGDAAQGRACASAAHRCRGAASGSTGEIAALRGRCRWPRCARRRLGHGLIRLRHRCPRFHRPSEPQWAARLRRHDQGHPWRAVTGSARRRSRPTPSRRRRGGGAARAASLRLARPGVGDSGAGKSFFPSL